MLMIFSFIFSSQVNATLSAPGVQYAFEKNYHISLVVHAML
jgi:hypothetical protein